MAGGMRKGFPTWLAAAIAAMPLAVAQAQVLVDPTRPPMSVAKPGAVEEAPPATQLQSILISSRRRIAVINGNTVALGDMIGEARVVKISETEVVLKTGEETEVLKMYPGIEKQPVKRGSAARGGLK
jgi:MSHA biogenesis protein MshK